LRDRFLRADVLNDAIARIIDVLLGHCAFARKTFVVCGIELRQVRLRDAADGRSLRIVANMEDLHRCSLEQLRELLHSDGEACDGTAHASSMFSREIVTGVTANPRQCAREWQSCAVGALDVKISR